MRWQMGRRSRNVEDRRGIGAPTRVGFPGGLRLPGGRSAGRSARAGGIGGIGLVVLLVLGWLLGIDPSALLQGPTTAVVPPTGPPPGARSPAEDRLAEFVSVVLADTEDTWHALFERMDETYEEPVLVLYTGAVESACGFGQAAMGPFYCPGDQRLYIDLGFYRDLQDRFGAPGDFAQAYVIAHEVGHHVQTLLGISQEVRAAQAQASQVDANRLSVALELQADCLAGVWAHHAHQARQILEEGDIEEGLRAAAAIGDDRMQRRAQGYVVPEAFTHGSSEQRVRWFGHGLENGDLAACNTFAAIS
jgi:predicted metalloprotease